MSMHVEQKYVGLLSPRLSRFKVVRPNLWNFRCPICGDSQKKKSKARGYIYQKKNDLFYKCHNCSDGRSLGNLIKELDPYLHRQYVMERYTNGQTGRGKTKEPEFNFSAPVFKKKTTIHLPSIEILPKQHFARRYYESRQIPSKHMGRVFFAEDFKKWAQSVCQVDYRNLKENDSRIVIPFFDEDGKMVAAQGRALVDSVLRYITVKVHENSVKLFGLERWDKRKTTYLLEGPIDSLFLPNAVAMAGVDGSDLNRIFDKKNTVIVLDNEPRNPEISKSMLKYAQAGWKVCIWDTGRILGMKDINQMILEGISADEICGIINKKTCSGLEAKWEVQNWRHTW